MRRREYSLHLRFSEEELRHLQVQAKRTGLRPQAYIHMLLEGCQPKEMPPADYFRMLRELGRIGNNLNQVAMVANATGAVDADLYWKNVRELQESIGMIRNGVW